MWKEIYGLRWRYKWRPLACLLGWHDWFDADGWLPHGEQYCYYCLKDREE